MLHQSCRYQSNTAKEVLDTILNIQPKDAGGGGGETRESTVYRMADDMLEKLPPDYIPHQVSEIFPFSHHAPCQLCIYYRSLNAQVLLREKLIISGRAGRKWEIISNWPWSKCIPLDPS